MEVQQDEHGGDTQWPEDDAQVRLESTRVGFDPYISVAWGRQ